MASEQYDAVFEESQDDDEDPSSSDNDLDGNDDVLNDEEDEELLEEEDINSPSFLPPPIAPALSSASIPAVPLAVPSATVVTVASVPTDESPPDSKRQRVDSAVTEKKPAPPQQLDESRRLFQRLWTDEDEIELLQGFLDYTNSKTNSNSSSSHHHHYDTALFYDQIKSKLQLVFNKNQLVEKLRRLKKKYRNVMNKISSGKDFSFKSPHDHATFEISRKIWNSSVGKVEDNVLDDDDNNNNNNNNTYINLIDESGEKKNFTPKSTASKKRSRSKGGKMEVKRVLNDGFVVTNNNFNNRSNNDNGNVEGFAGGRGGGGSVAGVVEEAVKSCLTPLFKELLGSVMGGGGGGRGISGLVMNAMPLSFGGSLNFGFCGGNGELVDERWRKQQIMELEVYARRLELVQDQIKAALEELRSMGG
ncbi:probable transcription factor At3g04930 [Durio zibethinus]|uniref:Probable transcription factor At3g04930 n=1 Tax=Durio zibethinus TaxID=66656 RepID=A0A6P5YX53_DURZI|nr:probable transcription factor At3g04930 [Durio zibethinus]